MPSELTHKMIDSHWRVLYATRGIDVSYIRGAQVIPQLRVVPTFHDVVKEFPDGSIETVKTRTYVIPKDSLDFGTGRVDPQEMDLIVEDDGTRYEVNHPAGSRQWDPVDEQKQLIRIYSVEVK